MNYKAIKAGGSCDIQTEDGEVVAAIKIDDLLEQIVYALNEAGDVESDQVKYIVQDLVYEYISQ